MPNRRPFAAEELWRLARVTAPDVARDGSFLVVPVTTHDLEENRGISRLWRVPAGGGEARPLTAKDQDAKEPAISPDGTRVVFTRKKGDHSQLFLLPLDGGEPEQLTDLPLGAEAARWLPDGSGLVLLGWLLKEALTVDGTRKLLEQRAGDPVDVHVTEDRLYRFWDRWLTDGKVPHLFRLDFSGGDPVDLTPDSTRWWNWEALATSYDVAPDGAEIAFSADTSSPPHSEVRWAVFTVSSAGSEVRCLTADHHGHNTRPRYSPDGRYLLYGRQEDPLFYADRVRLVRYERNSGEHTVLTEEWDRSAGGWQFAGPGELVLVAEDHGRVKAYRLDIVAGGTPELLGEDGSLSQPRPAADGSLYLLRESLGRPPEVVLVDENGLRPVTGFNDEAMAGLHLGAMEEVTFPGAQGTEVQAFVVYPPDFSPQRRWPLVHLIHGGPHGIFGDQFHFRWNAHVFAAAGYVVMMVNFHGSTSFGQDYAASIRGAWGDRPTADILAATDLMVERGFIDDTRIGITGGSYGGYLTTWLTSQTDRFACAVAHAAVTNLGGMYASDWTEGRGDVYGAEIWEDRAVVERWSPAAHAAGYSTPTLVIHGELDYRVPLTQGLELYGVLRAKGVPSRLVYYPNENHWILKPRNSLHWYGEVLAWLERWLGNDRPAPPDSDDSAPEAGPE